MLDGRSAASHRATPLALDQVFDKASSFDRCIAAISVTITVSRIYKCVSFATRRVFFLVNLVMFLPTEYFQRALCMSVAIWWNNNSLSQNVTGNAQLRAAKGNNVVPKAIALHVEKGEGSTYAFTGHDDDCLR